MMEKENKTSGLAGIPAVGLSLMTFFGSLLLAFLLDRISSSELSTFSTTEIIPMLIYVMVIVGASFFICRTHPRSVWYTPFICNALGIIIGLVGALEGPDSQINSSFWIVVIACLLLSIAGSIIGARIGRK